MSTTRIRGWWRRLKRSVAGFRPAALHDGTEGITYIEIAFMMLIFSILIVSLTTALRSTSKGTLVAKERAKAMALAQDMIEEVRSEGYDNLRPKISRYMYPTIPDPNAPLSQLATAVPYPATPPLPGEDVWTPEQVLSGGIVYWRHVIVKCVEESGTVFVQRPPPNISLSVPGGTDSSSNLMLIEVDVTWAARLGGGMRQVRLTSLVARTDVPVITNGEITGTVFDAATGLPVTGVPLTVYTTNPATQQSFTANVNQANGSYDLTPLPDGTYTIRLSGAPSYYDSSHSSSGLGTPPAGSGSSTTLFIGPGSLYLFNKDIRTKKVKKVTVYGQFAGALNGETVEVQANDGLSSATQFVVGTDCTGGAPCSFTLPNLSLPTVGTKTVFVTLYNQTQAKYFTATLCMDSATTATDFFWGKAPPYGPTCGACGGVCQQPVATAVLSANAYSNAPASLINILVQQYYNNSLSPLPGAKVTVSDGTSVTRFTSSSGTVMIDNITPSPGGTLKLSVWYPGTGYTSSQLTIANDLLPSQKFDMSATPLELIRVASISGTVYKTCNNGNPPCGTPSTGYANIPITISNNKTEFSAVVMTDAAGNFSHSAIPMEASDPYTITPATGSDYNPTPDKITVTIDANGVNFAKAPSTNVPFEFYMVVVNGVIKGTVKRGGQPYAKGALIFATTHVGAFPTTLPSSLLSGDSTYSTVTGTDGTYSLKVATGQGDYTVLAYSPDNSSTAVSVSVTAGQPVSGGQVTAPDIVIP